MKPKVVYIAGWSRSGTSILESVLARLDGFCSVGELHYLWSYGLRDGGRCGCGLALDECAFWKRVLDVAFSDTEAPDPERCARLQARQVRTRHLPRLWRDRKAADGSGVSEYVDILERLYKAIFSVSGATTIVDSSKFPADAYVASFLEVDLYVIHVVRDPRAVAYSWSRTRPHLGMPGTQMPTHGPLYSSVHWSVWNAAIATLLRQRVGKRYMCLRYEDFVASPMIEVGAIATMLGQPDAELPFRDERTVELRASHSAWGNDSRFSEGVVTLEPDTEWLQRMTRVQRALATLPAAPLMPWYRYPVFGAARSGE